MSGIAHFLHFVMVLLTGGFWIPIWVVCALCSGSGRKKREMDMKKEQLELLRQLVKEKR